MNPRPEPLESRGRTATGIAAVSAGMILFALVSHQGLPWLVLGAGGLLIAARAIAWSQSGDSRPAAVLGLDRLSMKIAVFTLFGVGAGAGGGLLHRNALGIALQPAEGVEPFVVVACLVGAAEELVYRGWLLGKARAFGWPAAVVIATFAHAAYKTVLFAWPATPFPVDLREIALWTAVGGIVLSLLRVFSGSVTPSIVAHVVFDFVVYRSVGDAPWWVWG